MGKPIKYNNNSFSQEEVRKILEKYEKSNAYKALIQAKGKNNLSFPYIQDAALRWYSGGGDNPNLDISAPIAIGAALGGIVPSPVGGASFHKRVSPAGNTVYYPKGSGLSFYRMTRPGTIRTYGTLKTAITRNTVDNKFLPREGDPRNYYGDRSGELIHQMPRNKKGQSVSPRKENIEYNASRNKFVDDTHNWSVSGGVRSPEVSNAIGMALNAANPNAVLGGMIGAGVGLMDHIYKGNAFKGYGTDAEGNKITYMGDPSMPSVYRNYTQNMPDGRTMYDFNKIRPEDFSLGVNGEVLFNQGNPALLNSNGSGFESGMAQRMPKTKMSPYIASKLPDSYLNKLPPRIKNAIVGLRGGYKEPVEEELPTIDLPEITVTPNRPAPAPSPSPTTREVPSLLPPNSYPFTPPPHEHKFR